MQFDGFSTAGAVKSFFNTYLLIVYPISMFVLKRIASQLHPSSIIVENPRVHFCKLEAWSRCKCAMENLPW